jgi:hypothetical protein
MRSPIGCRFVAWSVFRDGHAWLLRSFPWRPPHCTPPQSWRRLWHAQLKIPYERRSVLSRDVRDTSAECRAWSLFSDGALNGAGRRAGCSSPSLSHRPDSRCHAAFFIRSLCTPIALWRAGRGDLRVCRSFSKG